MGRYYHGDIEGKFWVAVQSSGDADFFGVEGHSNYLDYYFDRDNLDTINSGIKECEDKLGKCKKIIDEFFEGVSMYNDEDIKKYFKEKPTFDNIGNTTIIPTSVIVEIRKIKI